MHFFPRFDSFSTHAMSLIVIERFADVPAGRVFVEDWLVAVLKAQQAGLQHILDTKFILPRLQPE